MRNTQNSKTRSRAIGKVNKPGNPIQTGRRVDTLMNLKPNGSIIGNVFYNRKEIADCILNTSVFPIS